MMKDISREARLSKLYTNYCVRATGITVWSEACMADRHICHISGHRSTASFQHYNSRPSSAQLRECCRLLLEQMPKYQRRPLPKVATTTRLPRFSEDKTLAGCSTPAVSDPCKSTSMDLPMSKNQKDWRLSHSPTISFDRQL